MQFEEKKFSTKAEGFSSANCACLSKRLEKEKKDTDLINIEANSEESKFDTLIQKATGKKLINEFAALSEDLQFYAATSDWVMKEGNASKVEMKKLCQDPADFEKAVKSLCDKNGTSVGSQERLSKLLGTFNPSLEKLPFADGLKSLVSDIGTFTIDKRGVTEGKTNIFTRIQYDNARYSLSKDEPQVQVANDIVTMMLMDEEGMKQVLMDHISKGKSPLFAAMDILTGDNPAHSRFILSKLESKYKKDNQVFKKLKTEIGTEGFEAKVDQMFHVALNLHPGFKNLMNDSELFKKTASSVKFKDRDSVDVLSVMNNEKKIFNEHMKKRCESVQNNFAQAVCTKPEVARNLIGPQEMLNIIQVNPGYFPGSIDARELALCRMSTPFKSENDFFSNLSGATLNPYETSDYLDRMLNPESQNNGLAQMATKVSSDKRFADRLNHTIDKYDYARVGTGDYQSAGRGVAQSGRKYQSWHWRRKISSGASGEFIRKQSGLCRSIRS